MFCESCALRASCTKPCPDVEELLPQDHTARMVRAYATRGADFLRALERRHQEVLLMLDYRTLLRGRMRQVFDLKYIEGMTQEQAAIKLRIARRVAGIYLQRAHERISKLMSAQHHAH
ncbi:MAG: sigma-70 family RNA polymerase sigma factor [Planctomycetes bacterium]|jgi:DNA-directed RNA polymerase specialized sigma24 family protein|nr:sigma-70 family RNA polymerase sigma factor [Planctomycetota bacterium]